MFLVNSRLESLAEATLLWQTLSRSYGRLIAEFLNEDSLVHLGLLDLSTCVGLRYGRLDLLHGKLFWSAWVAQIPRTKRSFIRASTEV